MTNPGDEAGSASAYSPIDDYAIIGDCRSAALISREGSLDWLCWPRFDSPSVFAALLDAEIGGRFSVRPVGEFTTERRYVAETNVLETVFHGPQGSLVLRDAMVVTSEERKREELFAEHEIVRELEGLSGHIDMEVLYEPRPDYARRHASLEPRGRLGLWCMIGQGAAILQSDLPLDIAADKTSASSTFRISAGECRYFSLSYSGEGPAVLPALVSASSRLRQSIDWWQQWTSRCGYTGPWRDAVIRSLLTLKLMCFAPSGAIIAAPTTSLPEDIGGELNWDYRYSWLRDASFAVRALLHLGYTDEAVAYCSWLLQATRLSWPELQVLYDVYGETRVPEKELPHLSGYADSRPVRIGNGAWNQRQLDVYGELLDGISRLADKYDILDGATSRFLNGLGETVCEQWREKDSGIWESRKEPMHYTQSKVLCWVALDRLITMHTTHGLEIDHARFMRERDAIRDAIEQYGYNEEIGSYTQVFGGDALDASALTMPWYGYIDADHPRMASTFQRIREQLGRGPLMYRYAAGQTAGVPGHDSAFGVCGFWAVDCQARLGDVQEASVMYQQLLDYGNDLGLFAEEIDVETGAAIGNFPQAFTHIGVITTALTIEEYSAGTYGDESSYAGVSVKGIQE